MPGAFSPPPRVSDTDMHHGTCVTHVSWCMTGSVASGFLWSRWRGKRSRHSRRMHNPQFCVFGKRPFVYCDKKRIRRSRLLDYPPPPPPPPPRETSVMPLWQGHNFHIALYDRKPPVTKRFKSQMLDNVKLRWGVCVSMNSQRDCVYKIWGECVLVDLHSMNQADPVW